MLANWNWETVLYFQLSGVMLLLSLSPNSIHHVLIKMKPISLTDIFAPIAEGFVTKRIVDDIEPLMDINQ